MAEKVDCHITFCPRYTISIFADEVMIPLHFFNKMYLIFYPDHTTFHLFSQVITEKAAQTTIHLLMQDASATDSGVFECIPDNAPPAKVKVHILTAGNIVCLKKK